MKSEIHDEVASLLREAGERHVLPLFGRLEDKDIDTKAGPHDFVTAADRDAEEWLTPRLRGIVDCEVIGEEAFSKESGTRFDRSSRFEAAGAAAAWTIDPVDGTANFVKASDQFCTMVALAENGVPQKCWIWWPVQKELFHAVSEEGAWFTDREGTTSRLSIQAPVLELERMKGSGSSSQLEEPLKGHVKERLHSLPGRWFPGCGGVMACRLAKGEQEFFMRPYSLPWDHAPADLLCREAGGHSAMIEDESPYNASKGESFMVASSQEGWRALKEHLWLP